MTEQKLLELKQKIDTAKVETAELEAQRKYLVQQLEKEWGCKTPKEAKVKLAEMQAEVETLDAQIAECVAELQSKYEVL